MNLRMRRLRCTRGIALMASRTESSSVMSLRIRRLMLRLMVLPITLSIVFIGCCIGCCCGSPDGVPCRPRRSESGRGVNSLPVQWVRRTSSSRQSAHRCDTATAFPCDTWSRHMRGRFRARRTPHLLLVRFRTDIRVGMFSSVVVAWFLVRPDVGQVIWNVWKLRPVVVRVFANKVGLM